MNKNVCFLFVLLLVLFSSCSPDDKNIDEDVRLNFYPRVVTNLTVLSGGSKYKDNSLEVETWDVMKGDVMPADAFYMCIKTSDTSNYDSYLYDLGEIDYDKMKNEPETELERNMATSFNKYLAKTRTVIRVIDYRTTGVRDLQITANQNFAGIQAGKSLNDAFNLKRFEPGVVVNSDSKEIVVAWSDEKHSPKNINEWLYYEPLAQAYMVVNLATIPTTIPESIVFSIDLTTDDGTVLHTETPEVHLIP